MKKYLLIIFSLFFVSTGIKAQKLNYEKTSPIFIGFDLGHTWHTTDVLNIKNRFPVGAGVFIGGTINQNYSSFFSFDIRLRFIGGSWYGQDKTPTAAIENNFAVNSLYQPLGLAVQNFRTKQRDLDLELAIHFNRLKERTGIDPYIFGGVGAHWTRTKGDLTDAFGQIYPYNENSDGSIINQEYTTFLDKNSKGEAYSDIFEFNFQPSLGFGIGYFFNSNFSLGLEHRTTFFRSDYFDGTNVTQNGTSSKYKNDLYHYTSLYFKFYFNKIRGNYHDNTYVPPGVTTPTPGYPATERPNTQTPPNNETSVPKPVKQPPVVTFIVPAKTHTKSPKIEYQLQAHVQHVNSAENLIFTQDGRDVNQFSFDATTGLFQSTVILNDGENKFNLTGVNKDGVDSDETIILYETKKHDAPPVVTIIDPAISPYAVKSMQYTIRASIENISARNQLSVKLNGQTINNFNFTPNGNFNFSAAIDLKEGNNTFLIVGTNNAGKDADQVVLVFEKKPVVPPGNPPIVNYIFPNTNPYSTEKATEKIIATVHNVNNKQQIEVRVNGKKNTNFTFNNTSKRVEFDAHLAKGTNNIYVKGTNNYGSDDEETRIVYKEPAKPQGTPPEVTIVIPNTSPYTTFQKNASVEANVLHINSKEQIKVTVNNKIFTDFTFENSTKKVKMNLVLQQGNNHVKILVTNDFGSDSDDALLILRKLEVPEITPEEKPEEEPQKPEVGKAPIVQITVPSSDPHTTFMLLEVVKATVEHIDSKEQITVQVNQKTISNFTFNAGTKTVQFSAQLNRGINTVKISATNNFGSDFDETQIISRNLNEIGFPPEVTITQPSSKPYSTFQANENIEASVKNVNSKDQIEVMVNNQLTNNFTYSNQNEKVTFDVVLTPGINTVSVKATNPHGNDSDNTQIVYRPDVSNSETNHPPIISFLSPLNNGETVYSDSYTFKVKVENMMQKNDIELKLNNINVPPNNFEFNVGTRTVQYVGQLQNGQNTFKVSATNNFGSDTKTISVNRQQKESNSNESNIKVPCNQHPNIIFGENQANNKIVAQAAQTIKGTLVNIQHKNQIQVWHNNKKKTDFIFNAKSKSFEHKIQLSEGENTYLIRLTNTCSSVDKTLSFNYKKIVIKKPVLSQPEKQENPQNQKESIKKENNIEISIPQPERNIRGTPERGNKQREIRNKE